MAHYAFINEENEVIEVITGKDETETAPDGFSNWEEYYLTKRPNASNCLRTSYNTYKNQHNEGGTPFRGNYAGLNMLYDENLDAFIEKQPYTSWTLNEDFYWQAPLPLPDTQYWYLWSETAYENDNTKGWVKVIGD